MKMTIDLPVSEPMMLFLKHRYGEEYEVNMKDWLGVMVSSILTKKSNYQAESVGTIKDTEKYSSTYRLILSWSSCERHGIFLSQYREKLLRKCIEELFRSTLYDIMEMNKQNYDIDYKTTLNQMLEHYGICDAEHSQYVDALIRGFFRKRK